MTLRFRIPGSIEIFLLPPPLTDPAALSSFFQEALPEVAKALKMGPGTWDRKPLKKVPGPGWCFFTEETRYRGFRWLERKPWAFFGGFWEVGGDVECFGGWIY